MGYAKYREDDFEAINERLYHRSPSLSSNMPEIVPIFDCKYCDKTFFDKAALFQHTKQEHNIAKPLVFINNRIATDTNFVDSLQSVVIVRYGMKLEIIVNGSRVMYNDNDDEVDVTSEIYDCDKSRSESVISVNGTRFTIKTFVAEQIENSKISKVINHWEEQTTRKIHITKAVDKTFNAAELRYLDGFFNYFLACLSDGKDKDKRYEDAFYILSSFNPTTPIARCVLKVISFRLNWVEHLKTLCNIDDTFRVAYDFFINGKTTVQITDEETLPQLFVEDEFEQCLKVCYNYQVGNYEYVDDFLRSFSNLRIVQIDDSNFRDKILLLKARREASKGNKRLAELCYEEINAPFFQKEYNEFRRENTNKID